MKNIENIKQDIAAAKYCEMLLAEVERLRAAITKAETEIGAARWELHSVPDPAMPSDLLEGVRYLVAENARLRAAITKLEAECERLNELLRAYSLGQGTVDAATAAMEQEERLSERVKELEDAVTISLQQLDELDKVAELWGDHSWPLKGLCREVRDRLRASLKG